MAALWVTAAVALAGGHCLKGGESAKVADSPRHRFSGTTVTKITREDLPSCGRDSHHAANLVEGADGRPLLFWFAGSREGATNVCIMRARLGAGGWSDFRPVLDAAGVSKLSHRWVRKLGNPVAWRGGDGKLHLYVTTVTAGGWSGSRIMHLVSPDDGLSFVSAESLVLSPFFNFSTLVKSPALGVAGVASLPVYHEFMYKMPVLLGLGADGGLFSAKRMGAASGLLQPAVTRLIDGSYLSCLRTTGARTPFVHTQTSRDGVDWADPKPCPLFNPGSAVALASLPDGRPVMAYNDSRSDRHTLRLAVADSAGTWRPVGPVLRAEGEFSYPTLLAGSDSLHLAFTRNRSGITHMSIPYSVFDIAVPPSVADMGPVGP